MNDGKIPKPIIHPKCFKDEFPTGYLIRLAELNKYQSTNWLIKHISRQREMRSAHYFFDLVYDSPWTGYRNENDYINFIDIKPTYFEMSKMKFCPLCIKDQAYIRIKWQFRSTLICSTHNIWLHDSCNECGQVVSMTSARINICQCGARLDVQKHFTASPDVRKMQEFIEGRYSFNNDTIPNLVERLDLLVFFSKWFRHRKGRQGLLSCDAGYNPLVEAAEALFSGRSGLINFLKKLHELQLRSAYHVKHFDRFHHEFYNKFPSPIFASFREIIEEYINENWNKPLSGRNINFSEATIRNHPWIPLRAACRDYDISKSTFKQAFLTGLVRYKTEEKQKRKLTYLFKPDIDDRLFRLKDFITAKEAGLILGLNKQQFSQLKESNFFKTAISPSQSKLAVWSFSREEVFGLRNKLTYGLPRVEGDVWSFSHILKYYGGQIDNATYVVTNAIRTGELKAIGVDTSRPGLASMNFLKQDFLNWLQLRKHDREKLSITVVSKLLRVNQEFTYQLVNRGFLKAKKGSDGTRWVTEEGIEKFEKQFVILAKLAKLANVNSRVLQQYLSSRAIYPVDYKSENILRQKIYKKSDLVNINILKEFL